ncbi:beta-hydroxyacyl-ACP dehydratase [Parasulfuritortus cantonensis]|uniref:Beta-hydroxyacyl-ACP dehydratase n=1 Tax=Parasulfuritortus cantonensis TaxID=2528202 RepID=A0A4R1BF19_9PROT|nr:beta-hydroxyacyl-ACP dehydratase [Parasulfuritortus cantonensis]TCJ15776.1 beta-hydroxyacyl-ACP dehydratase [Parasulfuritortus cantonensis]
MTETAFVVPLPFEPDHPAFAGHFPGRPIIPGVQLIDRAQRLIEERHGLALGGLQVAKFLSPATPGEPLELAYRIENGGVSFEIHTGGRRVASGKFRAAEPGHP